MNVMYYLLYKYHISDEEYISICKKCFESEPKEIQIFIQESSTDDLDSELKYHKVLPVYSDYCKAIKYELMLRNDFRAIIY